MPDGKSPGGLAGARANLQHGLVQPVGRGNVAARTGLDVAAAQYLGDAQVALVLADPREQLQRQVLRHAGHRHHGRPRAAGSLPPPRLAAVAAGQDQSQLTDGPAVQVVDERDGPQRQGAVRWEMRTRSVPASGVKKTRLPGLPAIQHFGPRTARAEKSNRAAPGGSVPRGGRHELPRLPVRAIQPPSPTSHP